ncbi:MAG: nucleoside triphosphate hydrolase [Rhodobacteraceae bacterium]|nr:nucleoside triphosphate hydrolase [Paracoccaceae bacterium]
MRTSKSRSRSKQNRNRSVGNVVNRVFDSSGPEGKVRGTPQQIIEKYNQLARDAQLANDRVATENFQQHSEHYQRLLGQAIKEQEVRRENMERENRERQVERDRERSERNQRTEQDTTISEGFGEDLSQSEQPDIPEMSVSGDKLGLIETPEDNTKASDAVLSENLKTSRKSQRKPSKAKIIDKPNEVAKEPPETLSTGSDEHSETTA